MSLPLRHRTLQSRGQHRRPTLPESQHFAPFPSHPNHTLPLLPVPLHVTFRRLARTDQHRTALPESLLHRVSSHLASHLIALQLRTRYFRRQHARLISRARPRPGTADKGPQPTTWRLRRRIGLPRPQHVQQALLCHRHRHRHAPYNRRSLLNCQHADDND